jgi:hypothetical protein
MSVDALGNEFVARCRSVIKPHSDLGPDAVKSSCEAGRPAVALHKVSTASML